MTDTLQDLIDEVDLIIEEIDELVAKLDAKLPNEKEAHER